MYIPKPYLNWYITTEIPIVYQEEPILTYEWSGYNINSKNSKETALRTKYAYQKPEETVQVSSNRHETSITGTKKPEETVRAPNDRNKYD